MKIGEFSRKFNVSVSTVRHYINLGLLIPEKNGFQYRFTDTDCRDMDIISSMKSAGFKLDELNKYLSLYRFYNKDDYILYEKLLDFLSLKKQSLLEERDRIGTFIMLLNKCIKDVENERDSASRRLMDKEKEASSGMLPGVPLDVIDLLTCPDCGRKLNVSGADIFDNSIITGGLNCSCGYRASIENGVILTSEADDLDNNLQFLDRYFGEENLIRNEDGIVLMGMSEHSNAYLTNFYKGGKWIQKELEALDTKGKTMLFPDIACQYLYSYLENDDAYDNIFIVTALAERTIHAMRQHIANARPDFKVAYVINQDGRLPLRKNSIDIVVDYMGSSNLGFFMDRHYFDMIGQSLARDAVILGMAEYYRRDSLSLETVHRLYSHAASDVFTLGFINGALARGGFSIEKFEKVDEGYEPGRFFEYHHPGDVRTNIVYLAKRR